MTTHIQSMTYSRERVQEPNFVDKLHVRQRKFNDSTQTYSRTQGNAVTVERHMPVPYDLRLNLDIWTTNTEMKLQVLEQILCLFNPSLEIQSTDNYVDWTSLSLVQLENVNFSSRSIPTGTESDIDIATLTFSTPIYISPPVKVKRLGVITQVIQSIFNEDQGTIDLDLSRPTRQAYDDTPVPQADINTRIAIAGTGDIEEQLSSDGTFKTDVDVIITTAHDNYELLVMNTSAKLIKKGTVGAETWTGYLKSMPFSFEGGVTELRLRRRDITNELVGTVVVNPLDPYDLTISWDTDTLPSDTVFYGPNGDRNKIDYIINPYKTNPTDLKSGNPRILILDSINTSANVGEVEYDGPDGWKNDNGSDFVASANDIVEWDGTAWHIVFNASDEDSTVVYTTNLNTGKQYKYDNNEWTLAFDGEYPNGTWRLAY